MHARFERRSLFLSIAVVSLLAASACESTPSSSPLETPDASADAESGLDAGLDRTPDASRETISVVCNTPEELVAVPAAGETAPYRNLSPPRYQFGRCELVALLVDTARDMVAATPQLGPVGIVDLSEQSGAIPGTDEDAPRHPAPSHTNGFSVDVTYFRTNGRSLEDSPACPSKTREFCDGPHDLDVPANAKLFARLARSGRVVQIIVDPVMVSDLDAALAALTDEGAARARTVLTSGIPFHADHFHVSVSRACYDGRDNDGDGLVDLEDPGCADPVDDDESD